MRALNLDIQIGKQCRTGNYVEPQPLGLITFEIQQLQTSNMYW